MAVISFKPRQLTKRLTAVLQDRPRFVIENRFGLDNNASTMTLEAIGKNYNITRERVRQIENFALNSIKKSDVFTAEIESLDELRSIVVTLGGVVSEEDLLNFITNDKQMQNHIHLLLVLGDYFIERKENKEFKRLWIVDADVATHVEDSLNKLYKNLSKDDIVSEQDMVASLARYLENIRDELKNEEIIRRWLGISKKIGRNPLGEWGIANSSNINARGVRDYAFLVIRRHGSPMHFTEVASAISKTFGKEAHTATCHNELIKDSRFVLVGRGLYALKAWGYEGGVVKDVIINLLKKGGPLSRGDVISKVLNERYVKENTVLVNLQDSKIFGKDESGRYYVLS